MDAKRAKELTETANDAKICYDRIKDWFTKLIEKNAKEGMTGCRANLIEKRLYFDSENGKWEREPKNWVHITELLEKDMRELGFNFSGTVPRDFHVTW